MAIIWYGGQFVVRGRMGASRFTIRQVDRTTTLMQRVVPTALALAERNFNQTWGHQAQGSMRAHHVSDHVIQQAICDYLNASGSPGSFADLLSTIGTLYQTSWIDLMVTPRLLIIWAQWVQALTSACITAIAQVRGTPDQIANTATSLAGVLSSSMSNLRVAQGNTDGQLGDAIAPRMRNGSVSFDLPFLFASWASGQFNLRHQPSLSFETTLVASHWRQHFLSHPPTAHGGAVVINGIYLGRAPNLVYISEEGALRTPIGMGMPVQTRPLTSMRNYPGTGGWGMATQRVSRSFLHLLPLICILIFIAQYSGDYSIKKLLSIEE